jgi:hypothetical protein
MRNQSALLAATAVALVALAGPWSAAAQQRPAPPAPKASAATPATDKVVVYKSPT